MNRRQPASTLARNNPTVATTFTIASPAGSRTLRETPPCAARWRITCGRKRATRTADLVETLSDISPGLAVLAALGAFSFIVARAWRYRLLLGIERSKTGTLLAITFASWGASLVLPGPSGDAAFVVLARTRLKTPVAVGAGAAVLSRLLDVASLVLIALATAPLAGVNLPKALLIGGLLIALLISAGLTAMFWPAPDA